MTPWKGADHYVMRELNRSLVVDVLKANGPISRADIAKTTELAKPTVSAIVEELLTSGLAREIGMGKTAAGGGRPPILVEYNAQSQFVAGVHVGATTTTVAVADARGNELVRMQRRTVRRRPAQTLSTVGDLIDAALIGADVDRDRLIAIGVGIPGLIDFDSGTCLLAPNLGWRDVDVRETLQGLLGCPVYVHNTAQVAAVAETVEGAAKGAADVVLLYAGTGVGAGVLHKGQLFHGARGITGEIGHCAVPLATAKCNCGKLGCLETIASASAIVAAAKAAIDAGRRTSLSAERSRITAELVANAAMDGDRVAGDLLSRAGSSLGLAASWLANLFNPQVVVLGGALSGSGDSLVEPFREAMRENTLAQTWEGLEVRTSSLGQDEEVRGAVLLALQNSETYLRLIFQS